MNDQQIPDHSFDLIEKIKHVIGCTVRLFVTIDPGKFPPPKYVLTAEYSREKSYLYVFRL